MIETLRKAVLNTVAAGGNNVVDDATGKQYIIPKTGSGADNLLPPIPYGSIKDVEYAAYVTEVTQMAVIGLDSESVVAGRKYGIKINRVFDTIEAHGPREFKFNYTAPVVLTGTAGTDRYNMYAALAAKINAYAAPKCEAFILYKIPFTLGTTSTGTVGTTTASPLVTSTTTNKVRGGSAGVQETSAVTMNIAAIEITSAVGTSLATNDAEGNIWVYNISDTASWNTGIKTLTFTDAVNSENIVVTANCALTTATILGQGMVIVDDAGYSAFEELDRTMANEVFLTSGFQTAEVAVARDPYYSTGSGAVLLALTPQLNREGNDVITGDMGYYVDGGPFDATKVYGTFKIRLKIEADADSYAGMTKQNEIIHTLWAHDDLGVSTNLADLKTALDAMV